MATVDLWPAEIATDGGLEGPTTLLKEQAVLLGQKTKNVVEAKVYNLPVIDNPNRFVDDFAIESPTLDYRYHLFQVSYPIEFYPARIIWEGYDEDYVGSTPSVEVNSREELQNELHKIFSHPKTIRVIQSLIARSKA